MSYTAQEGRTQLLADLAAAADELAVAIACLTEAYEGLDEDKADVLEREMFRPVQSAYGRARRTHGEFAGRVGLPEHRFAPRSAGQHSADPKVYIERALDAVERCDHRIAELQDSMLPVEVGDTQLRAGLAETRTLIAEVPARGRRLVRTFGR
jgi:hypothetical protein